MKVTKFITRTSIIGLTALILGAESVQAVTNSGDSEATVRLKKRKQRTEEEKLLIQ